MIASQGPDIAPSRELLEVPGNAISAEAIQVGERIDVRGLRPWLAVHPMVVPVCARGWAAVFRYGAVVFYNVPSPERMAFLKELGPRIIDPYAEPEREHIDIQIDPAGNEGVSNDEIRLREPSVERLQVVAEALAKSVVMAHYEESIAEAFADVEPLAQALERGKRGIRASQLIGYIGRTVRIQHKMVGRAEVPEKPELSWDDRELELLYLRLEDEYELRERHLALERKLALISSTAQRLLDLLHTRRSLRVEWYIVALILVEIFISLYELFLH